MITSATYTFIYKTHAFPELHAYALVSWSANRINCHTLKETLRKYLSVLDFEKYSLIGKNSLGL